MTTLQHANEAESQSTVPQPGPAIEIIAAFTRIQETLEDQCDVIQGQAATIADLVREMGEMDKEIDNLVEALELGHAAKIEGFRLEKAKIRYETGKNSNRGESMKIGLRECFVFAPTYLARDLTPPIMAALTSVGLLTLGLVRFTFSRPGLLILGALGRLKEPKIAEEIKS